jgi:Tetratricopeptide repeat.
LNSYTSAFYFLNATINLKPTFCDAYLYMGIVLGKLKDYNNAVSAFEKAVQLSK